MTKFEVGKVYSIRYEKDRRMARVRILSTDGLYATYRYIDDNGEYTTLERRNKVMEVGGMEILMADTWVRSDDVETA